MLLPNRSAEWILKTFSLIIFYFINDTCTEKYFLASIKPGICGKMCIENIGNWIKMNLMPQNNLNRDFCIGKGDNQRAVDIFTTRTPGKN